MNPLQVQEVQPGKGRKKRALKDSWKRNVAKRMRYSAPSFPRPPSCNHKAAEAYRCSEVTYQDVRRMHQRFYGHHDREGQQNFILHHVVVCTPKRGRSRNRNSDFHRKKVSTKYLIPCLNGSHTVNIQVCKKLFIQTLCVSGDRVQSLCRKFLQLDDVPVDKRGGDKISIRYSDKRQSVKEFINSLTVLESHYCRSKNITRQYLPSELSIKSLWTKYQDTHDKKVHVKYDYFRSIFDSDFNIGFGSPATDCCSVCLSLKERIKKCTDVQQRKELQTELIIHEQRAKAFYDILRHSNEQEITFSFDCQKNQPIPKIPDQSAYYLRQLYLYNFTICVGNSKESQRKENTFSYVWLEDEYKKGSNQIASALHHQLLSADLTNYKSIKLVADGCGGQNKNKILIAMLCKYLAEDAPTSVNQVTLVFPVPGHSFIPPDRIFGRIESQVKKKSTILTRQDYENIIESHATLKRLGEECPVLHWKDAVSKVIKEPGQWHFKLQPCKRVVITRTSPGKCVIRGEVNYNTDIGEPKSVLKRGKMLSAIKPKEEKKGIPLKKEKVTDLNTLLKKHFGNDWVEMDNLLFFKTLFSQQESLTEEVAENDSDLGELLEEKEGLIL
ncbi:uncharacterized protein LOC134545805 [Bacillus rossius redtenbacheri]|uniref:uncharacterized protein LOC134529383 n=1 Tax=Bacillus rossius redtenbacheri TaxID=93214 RepID=UPI002FDDA3A9